MALSPEEEQRRLELYHQGLSDSEIGRMLFYSPSTIQAWRKARGLPGHLHPGYPHNCQKIRDNRLELYRQGLDDHEIARRVGRSSTAILYWRRRNRLPANPRKRRR